MKTQIVAVTAALLLALGITPAFADENSGFYAGAGVGRFNVKIDNPGDVTDAIGSFDADDATVTDDDSQDFVYGGGIGVTLFERLNARLEYEVIDVGSVDDANALWVSAAWRF